MKEIFLTPKTEINADKIYNGIKRKKRIKKIRRISINTLILTFIAIISYNFLPVFKHNYYLTENDFATLEETYNVSFNTYTLSEITEEITKEESYWQTDISLTGIDSLYNIL